MLDQPVSPLQEWLLKAEGRVLMTGVQALVRLPMLQRDRDRAVGLNTAGYVSGYRGSPLGGIDSMMARSKTALRAHDITFHPGLNEELAATALWGTQQIDALADATVDGVFGYWYGKGPGVERAADALRHGNFAGAQANGGVLVVFGDGHPGKSSTTAHQSEQTLAALSIPVLYPADVQDYLRLGLL
ncbi:MAG: indolepyruvate ferredoxin oxidoreductase family protein, partial [Pararhodobacter sp.]|nr:indolepyruvate ferredoxin oxidoreductase family protein [Pararhodobacter sp.]